MQSFSFSNFVQKWLSNGKLKMGFHIFEPTSINEEVFISTVCYVMIQILNRVVSYYCDYCNSS